MFKTFVAATAIAVFAGSAAAQGFYADAGYQMIDIKADLGAGQEAELDLGALIGHVGYDFNNWFALEGEAAVGISDETDSVAGISATVEVNYLIGVYARANANLTENFSVYARAGIVNAEIGADVTGFGFSVSDSDSETAAAFGAGAEFMFTSTVGVRGDYTNYDFEDADTNAYTLAAVFKF